MGTVLQPRILGRASRNGTQHVSPVQPASSTGQPGDRKSETPEERLERKRLEKLAKAESRKVTFKCVICFP